MTTSGVTTWNPVRDVILKRALRIVRAYASTSNPRPEQLTDALLVLNIWLKTIQIDEPLWLSQQATLFLNEGQMVYKLAPTTATGFAHCAIDATGTGSGYVQTTTASALAIGGSSVTVTSATGMSTGDYIGIENDSGTIEWSSLTISGTTATLGTVMSVAAASGNLVYSHTTTTQIKRPTKVKVHRKEYDSTANEGSETEIEMVSKEDYFAFPSKTTKGSITHAYYDPQLVSGKLYIYPTADYCGDKLILTLFRPIDDLVADTETVDLPVEWINAATLNLADLIAPEYNLPLQERNMLKRDAMVALDKALNFNRSGDSIFFEVN